MSHGAGRIEQDAAGRWGRLPALSEAGLVHGFSCRHTAPGDPAARLAASLDLAGVPQARLLQRHTAVVHRGHAGPQPQAPPVGDALVARGTGVVLAVSTADCVPLLAIDPVADAFAVVHAGWRGTLAGILPAVIGRLVEELGAAPERLRIGVGPAIRACCYEVGPEIPAAFERAWPEAPSWSAPGGGGRPHLDLVAANRAQATALGVKETAWIDGGWCTRCRSDLFWSYRAHGPGAGRISTLAARPSASGPDGSRRCPPDGS